MYMIIIALICISLNKQIDHETNLDNIYFFYKYQGLMNFIKQMYFISLVY